MQEIWKEIKGFDGRFSVSNFGRIRQNKLVYISLCNRKYNYEEKILEPCLWQSRYLRIDLQCHRKGKAYRLNTYIHKLVAEYFIGERPEGFVIDHIDGNYLNNRVDNLRYVTRSENAYNPNTYSKMIGRKVTDEQRKYISLRTKEAMQRPEVKAKMHKKHNMSEENRMKLRQNMMRVNEMRRQKRIGQSHI